MDFQEYNKYKKYLFIYYIYYLYPRLYTNRCKIILKDSKELLDYKVKNTKTYIIIRVAMRHGVLSWTVTSTLFSAFGKPNVVDHFLERRRS